MYYLLSEKANAEKRIITEKHSVVQQYLKESDTEKNSDKIIKWMWGYDKKSENIFDLVEPNDLVLGLETFDEEPTLHKVTADHGYNCFECGTGKYVLKDSITTIYKQNFKGDYIKVWEK